MKGFGKQAKRKNLRVFSKALEKDKFINLFINQIKSEGKIIPLLA